MFFLSPFLSLSLRYALDMHGYSFFFGSIVCFGILCVKNWWSLTNCFDRVTHLKKKVHRNSLTWWFFDTDLMIFRSFFSLLLLLRFYFFLFHLSFVCFIRSLVLFVCVTISPACWSIPIVKFPPLFVVAFFVSFPYCEYNQTKGEEWRWKWRPAEVIIRHVQIDKDMNKKMYFFPKKKEKNIF